MSVQCDHPSSDYEQCYTSLRLPEVSWGAGDIHRCHMEEGHAGKHMHKCDRDGQAIWIGWVSS